MKRKHQVLTPLLLAIVATGSTLNAQPPVGPGKPGPAPFGAHRPVQASGMISLTTLSGTVQKFTANDEFILNGFTLQTGAKTIIVQFPSHLGQAIQKASKLNDEVTVTGVSDITPEGEAIFRMVGLTNGKNVVTDGPPSSSPVLAIVSPTPITAKGKVVDYLLNKQGQVNGLLLSDQTLVKVPPHAVGQLITIAPKETNISVEGYVRPVGEGQVRLQQQTIVEASLITVNGQSFWVR